VRSSLEERRLRRVSKDELRDTWFETALTRLLTMSSYGFAG
jgi:hypothetical protein